MTYLYLCTKAAVSHSPNHPLAHHLRASMDFHSGAYVQAAEECRSLLEWAPDYPLSWLLLSRSEARLGQVRRSQRSAGHL